MQATYAILAKDPVQAVKMLNQAFSFPFTVVGTRRENADIILCDVILPDLEPDLNIICQDHGTLANILGEFPLWSIVSQAPSDDGRLRFGVDVYTKDGYVKQRLFDAEDYKGLQFVWWFTNKGATVHDGI